jgi:alpha-beta hydrolase superfamily lysophospholipase
MTTTTTAQAASSAPRREAATGPATAPGERFSLTTEDGFRLDALSWRPAGPVRGILVLVHGMSEHKERYAAFAQACAADGLAVYAYDHRGHGASVDAVTPLGHYGDLNGWARVVGDLEHVVAHARAAHPGAKVFVLGHSMGSFIVRAFLIRQGASVAGAIISATGFRLGQANRVLAGIARLEAFRHGPRAASKLMGKLVFGSFNLQFIPARTSFDWLSRDAAQVDAYIADPLCGFDCSGQLWSDLLSGVFALERAEADPLQLSRVPLLVVAGSRDAVSMGGLGSKQLCERYRAAGGTDLTDQRYPGGRHELMNETNRGEVWRDLREWIAARM